MVALRRFVQVALVLYWIFALTMTHIPHPPPLGPVKSDKVAHFLGYGALTGLLFLALWFSRPNVRYLPLVVLGIVMAYGAFDELTQPFFHRDAEFADWLADSSAAVVAVTILGLIRHLRKRPIAPAEGVR